MQLHDVPQANILYDLGMLTPGNAQEETNLNLASLHFFQENLR